MAPDAPGALSLDELARKIHATAREKGFYDREYLGDPESLDGAIINPSLPAEKLCLAHSEISEALEAQRDGDRDAEAEEVADTIIRLLDYSAWRGFNMDLEIEVKMAKNAQRPRLHGRHF